MLSCTLISLLFSVFAAASLLSLLSCYNTYTSRVVRYADAQKKKGCSPRRLYMTHVSLLSSYGRWWLTIVVLQCQIITFSQWTSETAAIAPKPKQFTLMPALSVCPVFLSGYGCSYSQSDTEEVDRQTEHLTPLNMMYQRVQSKMEKHL